MDGGRTDGWMEGGEAEGGWRGEEADCGEQGEARRAEQGGPGAPFNLTGSLEEKKCLTTLQEGFLSSKHASVNSTSSVISGAAREGKGRGARCFFPALCLGADRPARTKPIAAPAPHATACSCLSCSHLGRKKQQIMHPLNFVISQPERTRSQHCHRRNL